MPIDTVTDIHANASSESKAETIESLLEIFKDKVTRGADNSEVLEILSKVAAFCQNTGIELKSITIPYANRKISLLQAYMAFHDTSQEKLRRLGHPEVKETISKEITDQLLNMGVDLHYVDDRGNTALHFAAGYGNALMLSDFIQRGADPLVPNDSGETPISWASFQGQEHCIKRLLEVPGSLIEQEGRAAGILAHAVLAADYFNIKPLEIVKRLIGADVDMNHQDESGNTALHRICQSIRHLEMRLEILDTILAGGADLNIKNKKGHTPLIEAVQRGELELAKRLIEYGARLDEKSEEGLTAMHYAAGDGHIDMVNLLIDHNAYVDIFSKAGMTPLHLAIKHHRHETFDALMSAGSSIHLKNQKGIGSLAIAAESGNLKAMNRLLGDGLDINEWHGVEEHSKDTALMIASGKNDHKMIEELIRRGALINLQNEEGTSALHLAILWGELPTVEYLVHHGADITQKKKTYHNEKLCWLDARELAKTHHKAQAKKEISVFLESYSLALKEQEELKTLLSPTASSQSSVEPENDAESHDLKSNRSHPSKLRTL